MSKAPHEDQRRLLDVQDLDTAIDQAVHRRATLPAAQRLADWREQHTSATASAATARAELGDVQRELTRCEDEVEKVKARRQRDREQLDAGVGQAKDLVALQHEIETLNRRLSDLEDTELDIMERVESAEALVEAARAVVNELATRIAATQEEVTASYAAIDAELDALRADRGALAETLDAKLLTLYERVRAVRGGVGAAALLARRCEGCRLMITAAELARMRQAPPDEVFQCEECGRILVRVEGSGL